MKLGFCILIFVTVLSIVSAQSNNPYIHNGSLGKKVVQVDSLPQSAFDFVPISKWVGQRFIFLPLSKELQKYDYPNGFPVDYNKFVGRIAKVISVNKGDYFHEVTIKMEDDGTELNTKAYLESIGGIALVADIDSARSRWLNKTLWSKEKQLSVYEEKTDEYQSIKLKKYSPVKVIDIVAGWHESRPIRFILRTEDGNEGFVDLNLSGTNISPSVRMYYHFEEIFLEYDPRKLFNWSNNVWEAIEQNKVFIGMTDDQAKFSWGGPKKINRTYIGSLLQEQWVYSSGSYLYFENGLLTSIQN